MREAIKSHGQSTPLNAPTVKRRTRFAYVFDTYAGKRDDTVLYTINYLNRSYTSKEESP